MLLTLSRLTWVSIVWALRSWDLSAESIIFFQISVTLWLLAAGLTKTTELARILVATLGSLLRHALCSRKTLWRWQARSGCLLGSRRKSRSLLWGWVSLGSWSLLRGRKGSSWMSHWRVLWWLSSCLWLFTVAIDVLISRAIKVEGTELNSSAVNSAVTWHAYSLLLIKYTALVASSSSTTSSSLKSRCSKATGWRRACRLLWNSNIWCVGSPCVSWIPRACNCACSCSSWCWVRGIEDLFKIGLSELVFRWGDRLIRFFTSLSFNWSRFLDCWYRRLFNCRGRLFRLRLRYCWCFNWLWCFDRLLRPKKSLLAILYQS